MFEQELLSRVSMSDGVTFAETPATQSEAWNASFGLADEVEGRYSHSNNMKSLYSSRLDKLKERLGEAANSIDPNLSLDYPARDIDQFKAAYLGDETALKEINNTGKKQSFAAFKFQEDLAANMGDDFLDINQLEESSYADMRAQKEGFDATLARNTDHLFTELGGAMGAEFKNPDFYLSLMVGGQYSKSATVMQNIMRVGMAEALVGSTFEAARQTDVMETLERAGIDYSWQEAAEKVILAGAGGAIIGGGLAGLVGTGGKLLKKIRGDKTILSEKLAQSLSENTDDIKASAALLDEIEPIIARIVSEHGEDVPIGKVQQDIASYVARKNQLNDFINNGDSALDTAKLEFIERLLPDADKLLSKGELKALNIELKDLEFKIKEQAKTHLNKRQSKKQTGDQLTNSKVKNDETLEFLRERVSEIKATLIKAADAKEAARTITNIEQGVIPEEMMQRVLELREIKAGESKVPLANGDGLVPLSVPTKAKAVEAPAPKTPDNAEAETTIEAAAKNNEGVDYVYDEILTKADRARDEQIILRAASLAGKMGELEIPIGVKGTDSSELETVTVSADALMKGQDIEIAGLKSVLDCVRGG